MCVKTGRHRVRLIIISNNSIHMSHYRLDSRAWWPIKTWASRNVDMNLNPQCPGRHGSRGQRKGLLGKHLDLLCLSFQYLCMRFLVKWICLLWQS